MQKFEYYLFYARVGGFRKECPEDVSKEYQEYYEPNLLFAKNEKNISPEDIINHLGLEGWKLISTTPLFFGDVTRHVLFTFIRPIE